MRRFIVRLLINALALWLTVLILSPHVAVTSWEPGTQPADLLTYLIVALVFGIVNGIVGNLVRIIAFPLYVITLGLLSLVVNALLLILVAWLTGLLGFGLSIEDFWWGVLGAILLGVFSWIIGIILRPLMGRPRETR
ncbi:phage holin family protein [Schumannella sp. 10F1B-5-1]|uniref:phage holin family protein n=1 Tax=Schumannella sp. 10F1B-5-1 TaxID=2590780 RepID=UPI0011305444|nr:phage holin family protein [Schumannella sp. 10F1B-5-1]TPW76807.1 phage holin family protein [Schumannella sp. 10F1B-5-1]